MPRGLKPIFLSVFFLFSAPVFGALDWTPIYLGLAPFELFDATNVYGLNLAWYLTFREGGKVYGISLSPFHFLAGEETCGLTLGLGTTCLRHTGISFAFVSSIYDNRGVQAGLVNFGPHEARPEKRQHGGIQIGVFNQSRTQSGAAPKYAGVQIGLYNECPRGFQIGLYNECGEGLQIGLLNRNPNAWLPWCPLVNWGTGKASGE